MTTMTTMPSTQVPTIPPAVPGALRACLFVLGGERFAVEVERARGVVVLDDVTVVPGAPAHILGISNLRGTLIPAMTALPGIAEQFAGEGT